mgnify:FL=1
MILGFQQGAGYKPQKAFPAPCLILAGNFWKAFAKDFAKYFTSRRFCLVKTRGACYNFQICETLDLRQKDGEPCVKEKNI